MISMLSEGLQKEVLLTECWIVEMEKKGGGDTDIPYKGKSTQLRVLNRHKALLPPACRKRQDGEG